MSAPVSWGSSTPPRRRVNGDDGVAHPGSLKPDRALGKWWRNRSEKELSATLAKAKDYGSYDLQMIGQTLTECFGVIDGANTVDRAELGTWFYLLGKVARAMSAIQEGRSPSDDTIDDIKIYATMIQRIRHVGAWPGPIEEED